MTIPVTKELSSREGGNRVPERACKINVLDVRGKAIAEQKNTIALLLVRVDVPCVSYSQN